MLALVGPAALAEAQDGVVGQVHVGGGYDSNPSFAADPSNRRQPGNGRGRPMPAPPSMGDGVARVAGFVAGRLGTSPSGTARFDLDGRVFGSGDVLFSERLTLEGSLRIDDVSPRCRVEGSRLDLTASADSAWTALAACGVLARLPLGLWASADASGGARAFDAGQVDGLAGADVAAGWAMDVFAVDVGFSVVRRESDNQLARRTDLSPWITVRINTQYVGGQIGYRFIDRLFEASSRSGGEHTGHAQVSAMPLPWLGAYADLELGHAEGGSQALAYDRLQVTGGVRLVLDWHPEPSALPEPDVTQGPATLLDEGLVEFTFELADARQVSVVGDFIEWDEARGRLTRGDDGRFEGRFAIGPGRHEYYLLVDGVPTRPPGAERYVSDGFGGENAVLVVPGAP